MPLRHKHWQTVPQSSAIGRYQPAGLASRAVAGACLEFSFSSFRAGSRLVGVRNGEERGVDWGMTRPKTDERARKGRRPDFFLFPPPLPVCGDLLIVQTCLLCKIRNKCVGSRGRLQKKKEGGPMSGKKSSAVSAGESWAAAITSHHF